MEQAALERIIEAARCDRFPSLYLGGNQLSSLPQSICNLSNLTELYLRCNQLANLPENIGNLSNLAELNLRYNQLTSLPWSIGNLHNLTKLNLKYNQLASLPDSIGNLSRLTELDLGYNQLTSLPQSIKNLRNLTELYLEANPLEDLSILRLLPKLESVYFLGKCLPRRYWTKLSEWKPEWLLDEDNAEIRRTLIEQVGYERICAELNAVTLDTWREYTLLEIAGIEAIYDEYSNEYDDPIDSPEATLRQREPMVLLKMTCPSTAHVHILRVPPEMESAEAAITWVNHGIHPDKFAVQT